VAVGANTVAPTNALSTGDAAGIRHRLGLDGTATAPTAAGAKLGDLQLTQIVADASGTPGKIPMRLISNDAKSIEGFDSDLGGSWFVSADEGLVLSAITANLQGNLVGDVAGKVIGGGIGTILGVGVQVDETVATLAKQDEILEAIGDIEGGGGGGGLTGDYTLTVTVTDADTSAPIENATVTLSRTGERGAELTNVNGVAVVGLDAATWSWIVRAAGYESATGTVVVSGDQALSVELDGIVVETPSNPDSSVLTVLCLDELGDPEPGVDIDIRIVTVPSGDTNIAYKGVKQTATSDVNGIASLQAIKGAIYEYKRGKAEVWKQVTIGSGATTNVSSFIGSP
jgi:hypothetical protein